MTPADATPEEPTPARAAHGLDARSRYGLSPNTAGYTVAIVQALDLCGYAHVSLSLGEGRARTRLYNAASRLGVKIETHVDHAYGVVVARVVGRNMDVTHRTYAMCLTESMTHDREERP